MFDIIRYNSGHMVSHHHRQGNKRPNAVQNLTRKVFTSDNILISLVAATLTVVTFNNI